jgi:hypothetical protein
MPEKLLPTEYHLEIYMVDLRGDPYFFAISSTPFMAISQGDYLNPHTLPQLPIKIVTGAKLKVTFVEHIIWKVEGQPTGHKLMVATEVVADLD